MRSAFCFAPCRKINGSTRSRLEAAWEDLERELRHFIEAESSEQWIRELFQRCGAVAPPELDSVTIAIDAPLGLPDAVLSLSAFRKPSTATRGWKPLSVIQDMIGSQATKAMHALARFTPRVESCGVWTDAREQEIKRAMYNVLGQETAVEALFPIIKQQREY